MSVCFINANMSSVSEIKVSYNNKIPSSKSCQIKSSGDAAQLLMESWNLDTIELYESFKIILLNNANKVKGIRAVTGFNADEAKTTREDDNSNILCIPGRFVKPAEAKKIVDAWLETPFSGADRHVRRLEKLEGVENEEFGI